MIVYFDTSAFVKMLVTDEVGSDVVDEIWAAADRIFTSTLLYPEARAAVARAHRGHRISAVAAHHATAVLHSLVADMELLAPTRRVVWRAGDLAAAHVLRGYDAVHLSTAIEVARAPVTVVVADFRLATAAAAEGLRVVVPAA